MPVSLGCYRPTRRSVSRSAAAESSPSPSTTISCPAAPHMPRPSRAHYGCTPLTRLRACPRGRGAGPSRTRAHPRRTLGPQLHAGLPGAGTVDRRRPGAPDRLTGPVAARTRSAANLAWTVRSAHRCRRTGTCAGLHTSGRTGHGLITDASLNPQGRSEQPRPPLVRPL